MPAATLEKEKVVSPVKRFQMPVPPSRIVAWKHADNSGEEATAIVTKIGGDTIDCVVLSGPNMLYKTGCKHRDDPALKKRTEPNPGGVFELTRADRWLLSQIGDND